MNLRPEEIGYYSKKNTLTYFRNCGNTLPSSDKNYMLIYHVALKLNPLDDITK